MAAVLLRRNAKENKFFCPSDRELALRGQIKQGWSTVAARKQTKFKEAGLQKEEIDHINRVLARAEELNRIEETRIGIQMRRYKILQDRCCGNGTTSCILCGADFTSQRSRKPGSMKSCHECGKCMCLRCKSDYKCYSGVVVTLCRLCFEKRELWKKSGAWLNDALPVIYIPEEELERVEKQQEETTKGGVDSSLKLVDSLEEEESDDSDSLLGSSHSMTIGGSLHSSRSASPAPMEDIMAEIGIEADAEYTGHSSLPHGYRFSRTKSNSLELPRGRKRMGSDGTQTGSRLSRRVAMSGEKARSLRDNVRKKRAHAGNDSASGSSREPSPTRPSSVPDLDADELTPLANTQEQISQLPGGVRIRVRRPTPPYPQPSYYLHRSGAKEEVSNALVRQDSWDTQSPSPQEDLVSIRQDRATMDSDDLIIPLSTSEFQSPQPVSSGGDDAPTEKGKSTSRGDKPVQQYQNESRQQGVAGDSSKRASLERKKGAQAESEFKKIVLSHPKETTQEEEFGLSREPGADFKKVGRKIPAAEEFGKVHVPLRAKKTAPSLDATDDFRKVGQKVPAVEEFGKVHVPLRAKKTAPSLDATDEFRKVDTGSDSVDGEFRKVKSGKAQGSERDSMSSEASLDEFKLHSQSSPDSLPMDETKGYEWKRRREIRRKGRGKAHRGPSPSREPASDETKDDGSDMKLYRTRSGAFSERKQKRGGYSGERSASPLLANTRRETTPEPEYPSCARMSAGDEPGRQSKHGSQLSSPPNDGLYGSVSLSMRYKAADSELIVTVYSCRGLRSTDSNGLSDPYVKLFLIPSPKNSQRFQTVIVYRTLNPVYNDKFIFRGVTADDLDQKSLGIVVMDHDDFSKDDLIGAVKLPLYEASECVGKEKAPKLRKLLGSGSEVPLKGVASDEKGRILLHISHSLGDKRLAVKIERAVGLTAVDANGYSDPYVKCSLKHKDQTVKKKTKTCFKTLEPEFDETLVFEINQYDLQYCRLSIAVWDHNKLAKDVKIGIIAFDTKAFWQQFLTPNFVCNDWYTLHEP